MSASLMPHVPTLMLATVFVSTMLAALLTCTWLQDRTHHALLWWAPGYAMAAVGTVLLGLRGAISNLLSIEIANSAIIVAAGCIWAGARTFERRSAPWIAIAIPALAWIVACRVPFFAEDIRIRVAVSSVTLGTFILLAAREFWRGRDERLVSRWPAIIVTTIYGTAMLARVPTIYIVREVPSAMEIAQSYWFGVMSLATLLYTTTLAFTLLALTKERTELIHRRAARLDPLTGLLNRRAFLDAGDACLTKLKTVRGPAAALVFDLDGFKQINDRFGHPVGDRVLELFGSVVRGEIRATDVAGRIGGEEFAAVLAGCDEAQALAIAERIREKFAQVARDCDAHSLNATVSIGVALAAPDQALAAVLAEADRAVYRAKAKGRNRVCVMERAAGPDPAALGGASALSAPRAA